MMSQDNCIICKKPLFGEKGKRLTDECYGVYLMRKRANKHGTYSDCSKGSVYLCQFCFEHIIPGNCVEVLNELIQQKKYSDEIEKIQIKGDWTCQ